MFADEADAGALSEVAFQNGAGIGVEEGGLDWGGLECVDGVGELGEGGLEDEVVIGEVGVAGDDTWGFGGWWGGDGVGVGSGQGDDGPGLGEDFGGVRAFFGVSREVGHGAVVAGIDP